MIEKDNIIFVFKFLQLSKNHTLARFSSYLTSDQGFECFVALNTWNWDVVVEK